jgi:integrase
MAREKSENKYHLFARPNKKARNKIWHTWWWQDGKRVTRSTEKRTKSEALQVVVGWELEDTKAASGTLNTFANNFFIPGRCPYLAWKAEERGIKEHTVYEHRKNLITYIIPELGSSYLSAIKPVQVETWLRTLSLSGSVKNSIINTLRIILEEARRAGWIADVPQFRRFARRSMHKDILTIGECEALFPDDPGELAKIWRVDDKDITGLMFGVMFRVILHAGMRPGEGRALSPEQVFPEYNGILIDRQLDSSGVVTLPKKGYAEDRRQRIVIIPQKTMELLTDVMDGSEFVFTFASKPIRKDYLKDRFKRGLNTAEIHVGERILVPYSLRYTFCSRSQGSLEVKTIMDMMGHRSEQMSEHYLRFNPEQFKVYQQYQEIIDRLWS